MKWTFDKLALIPEVYRTMNGPTEFDFIGTLRDWSVIPRLGKTVGMPTLITSGRHNKAMPFIAGMAQRGIP